MATPTGAPHPAGSTGPGVCYNRWMRAALPPIQPRLGVAFGGPFVMLAVLALAACGKSGSRGRGDSELERAVAREVGTQLGADTSVSCEGTPPRRCMASLAGSEIPIQLFEEAGALRWRIQGLVVSGTELQRQVTDELTSLGLEGVPPRCGPALQIARPGDRIACRLDDLGVAWASVEGDGSYSIELALGAAAVERDRSVEEAQLDELSRALDRDQGEDDDEEDGEPSGEPSNTTSDGTGEDGEGPPTRRAGSGMAGSTP